MQRVCAQRRWFGSGRSASCERGAAAEARAAAAFERSHSEHRVLLVGRLERGGLLLARAVDVLLHAAELVEQMLVLFADLVLREHQVQMLIQISNTWKQADATFTTITSF